MQQLLTLALHKLGYGYACPSANDLGDLFICYLVTEQSMLLIVISSSLSLFQLFFQSRELAVLQLSSLVKVVAALSFGNVGVGVLNVLTELLETGDRVFLVFPACFHGVKLVTQLGKLFSYLCQLLLRYLVLFLFEGSLGDLLLHDLSCDIIKLGRHGVHFRADGSAGFINKVDSLIGEKSVGNVTV